VQVRDANKSRENDTSNNFFIPKFPQRPLIARQNFIRSGPADKAKCSARPTTVREESSLRSPHGEFARINHVSVTPIAQVPQHPSIPLWSVDTAGTMLDRAGKTENTP
jgi:hypothetical protein